MEALVSVVVPVYKVETTLDRAVESIRNQTYKNLEIILVDDGSPDKSGEMCDEYAKKDDRIKAVHKENGGLSSARNAGIDAASGKYICFVDSDDTIEPQYVEKMAGALEDAEADLCMCGMRDFHRDEKFQTKSKLNARKFDNKILYKNKDAKTFYTFLLLLEESNSACIKMFRMSFFQESGLRFFTNLPIHEDDVFSHHMCLYIDSLVLVGEPLYNYFPNGSSITGVRVAVSLAPKVRKVIDEFDVLLKSGKPDKEHTKALILRKFWYCVDMVYQVKRFKDDIDVSSYKKFIGKYFLCYMFSTNILVQFKGAVVLKLFFPKLFVKMITKHRKAGG